MKRLSRCLIAALFIFTVLSAPAAAQQTSPQPTPASAYTYGAALRHSHGLTTRSVTGNYCGKTVIYDPANSGGNDFLGNAICVTDRAGKKVWYYYDWGSDPDATWKHARWRTSRSRATKVTIRFDAKCLLAFSAVECRQDCEEPPPAALPLLSITLRRYLPRLHEMFW